MNCASTKMSASRRRRIALLVLFDLGFLVEAVEFQLGGGLGAERNVHQPALR
jgi:hypothetical protein